MDQLAHESEGRERTSVDILMEGLINGGGNASERDFRVTRKELEVLARHYLEVVALHDYWIFRYLSFGRSENETWGRATSRLYSIQQVLEEDVFAKAVADVKEKWEKEAARLEFALATPVKCEECGGEFCKDGLFDASVCQECIDSQ